MFETLDNEKRRYYMCTIDYATVVYQSTRDVNGKQCNVIFKLGECWYLISVWKFS